MQNCPGNQSAGIRRITRIKIVKRVKKPLKSLYNPKEILNKLSEKYDEVKLATRKKPIEGKKDDPAHPSIYPTGEFKKMEEDEEKLLDLVKCSK